MPDKVSHVRRTAVAGILCVSKPRSGRVGHYVRLWASDSETISVRDWRRRVEFAVDHDIKSFLDMLRKLLIVKEMRNHFKCFSSAFFSDSCGFAASRLPVPLRRASCSPI